jgi:hypothetical protein
VRGDAELARGELERLAAATQRRQHVELVGLQSVFDEGSCAPFIEQIGQPADPGEDLHRRRVEIGTFASPSGNDLIDLVIHTSILAHLLTPRDIILMSRD